MSHPFEKLIPNQYHLKTKLEKDSPPPPPPSPIIVFLSLTLKLSLALTISIPVTLTLFENLFDFQFFYNHDDSSVPSHGDEVVKNGSPEAPPPQPPLPPVPEPPPRPQSPPPAVPDLSRLCIPRYCNGYVAGSANFRSMPSRSTAAIKGVIPVGDCVSLTGTTAEGDGVLWYGAINELPLSPSVELGARPQLSANQSGWIAACFVE